MDVDFYLFGIDSPSGNERILYRIQRKSGGVSGVGSGAWDYLHDPFNTVIAKYLRERLMVAGGLLLLSVSGIVPVFTDIYPVILGSRFLLGIGIGLVNVKAISMISERYSGREQETLLGFRSSLKCWEMQC